VKVHGFGSRFWVGWWGELGEEWGFFWVLSGNTKPRSERGGVSEVGGKGVFGASLRRGECNDAGSKRRTEAPKSLLKPLPSGRVGGDFQSLNEDTTETGTGDAINDAKKGG